MSGWFLGFSYSSTCELPPALPRPFPGGPEDVAAAAAAAAACCCCDAIAAAAAACTDEK